MIKKRWALGIVVVLSTTIATGCEDNAQTQAYDALCVEMTNVKQGAEFWTIAEKSTLSTEARGALRAMVEYPLAAYPELKRAAANAGAKGWTCPKLEAVHKQLSKSAGAEGAPSVQSDVEAVCRAMKKVDGAVAMDEKHGLALRATALGQVVRTMEVVNALTAVAKVRPPEKGRVWAEFTKGANVTNACSYWK